MRNRPGPPLNDGFNAGTLILAGIIVLGMMGAGYYLFMVPKAAAPEQTDAVPVQRVVPLSPAEVVERARDDASVAVFAARLAAEKGQGGQKAGRRPAPSKKGSGLVIEEVGASSSGGRSGTRTLDSNPIMKNVKELDEETKEIRRLRRLKRKMLREEREAARREAAEN